MHDFTRIQIVTEPARLGIEATAYKLGFQEHDIATLIRKGLLQPLGKPQPNAPKFFARCEVERRAADPQWLSKATEMISRHWRAKNERRNGAVTPRLPQKRFTTDSASPSRNSPADPLLSASQNH